MALFLATSGNPGSKTPFLGRSDPFPHASAESTAAHVLCRHHENLCVLVLVQNEPPPCFPLVVFSNGSRVTVTKIPSEAVTRAGLLLPCDAPFVLRPQLWTSPSRSAPPDPERNSPTNRSLNPEKPLPPPFPLSYPAFLFKFSSLKSLGYPSFEALCDDFF